jgi:polysaccharide biosynthesis transport protein
MNETTDAAAILAPLWKRKWLILAVAVLVAGATYGYYKRQPALYSASTQLDLSSGSEARQLVSGTQGRSQLSSHTLADAAAVITSSGVAEAVRARLQREHIRSKGLGKAHAKASSESDLVTITTEAGSAKAAARLANYYALAYLAQQRRSYRREIEAAIASTRRQLRRIEAAQAASTSAAQRKSSAKGSSSGRSAAGGSAVIQAASLASKINQLESELSVSSVQQISPATPKTARLVSPKPKQNAIFGFVVGLLLAAIAVFVVSRLDRRVRSLEQLEAIFDVQLLAALPRARVPIFHRDGQPRPSTPLLEPLRRLHASLQLADAVEPEREGPPRLILFVSPDAGDGRSTLIADLALVQRDAGARVAVIDADLRQPAQARLLDVSAPSGLVEVLAGAVPFESAVRSVGPAAPAPQFDSPQPVAGVSTVVRSPPTGSLSVLAGGGPAVNPPALLASQAMQELLRSAAADYDYVLVDAPPPLLVSDVMPLLRTVDGLVIVGRMEHTREASAERLAQLLARTSAAPVLGVIANSASRADIRRYGFSSASGRRRWPALLGR